MAATFNPSLPTIKDHIRLLLGDAGDGTEQADITSALLSDEMITAMLASLSYRDAVTQLASGLITRFGQQADDYQDASGLRLKWGERIKAWQSVIDRALAGTLPIPTSGKRVLKPGVAISKTDVQKYATGPRSGFSDDTRRGCGLV